MNATRPESPAFRFTVVAVVFESSLLLVAALLRWAFDVQPSSDLRWDVPGLLLGVAAAVPLLVLFVVLHYVPWEPLRRINRLLVETLGDWLATARWPDVLIVALAAGICEETLFRGVLQPWLGLAASNVLFGLAHFVTPTYALLAATVGFYFGWMADWSRNLAVPIVAHATYDFLGLLYLRHKCRQKVAAPAADSP